MLQAANHVFTPLIHFSILFIDLNLNLNHQSVSVS